MVNSIKEQTGTREQKPVSPLEQSQMVSQRDWWKIGFLITLALFLTTAGVLGFYVLKVWETYSNGDITKRSLQPNLLF